MNLLKLKVEEKTLNDTGEVCVKRDLSDLQNKSNVCEVARVDGKFKAMFQSQKRVFNAAALHRDSENQEIKIKVLLTLPINIYMNVCVCVDLCHMSKRARAHTRMQMK